jgi:hypothetical protein
MSTSSGDFRLFRGAPIDLTGGGMRRVWIITLFLAAAAASRATEVSIIRVWPDWQPGSEFKRISEYFTGAENTGGRTVLRSQPGSRQGYYFLVRVKNRGPALSGAKWILQVVAPSDPGTKTYSFTASLAKGSHLYDLGLTGSDWSGPSDRAVAWKLDVLDAEGHPIASAQSFVWALPPR